MNLERQRIFRITTLPLIAGRRLENFLIQSTHLCVALILSEDCIIAKLDGTFIGELVVDKSLTCVSKGHWKVLDKTTD